MAQVAYDQLTHFICEHCKHRGAWLRWKLLVDMAGKFYCSYACLRAAHPFCRECRQPIRRAS